MKGLVKVAEEAAAYVASVSAIIGHSAIQHQTGLSSLSTIAVAVFLATFGANRGQVVLNVLEGAWKAATGAASSGSSSTPTSSV